MAVVAVSTSAILVRWSRAPDPIKAFYRVAFTLAFLAPVAVTRSRESYARVRPRDAGVAAVSGTLLALHFAAWFESLDWTSVAASVTLVQAQPAFVAVGAWALLPYVTVVYGVCAGVLLCAILLRGLPLFEYAAREWLLFAAMALGPGVFGHTVVNWALAHVESSVVSVSLLGEPVASTLLAFALLSETPTPWTLAGGAVVLLGIVVTARGRPSG